MLVVALVPLAAFTALVVADLGSVSQATVDETDRTILEDQGAVQQRLADGQAKQLQVKIDAITAQLRQLRDAGQNALRARAAPGAPRMPAPQMQTAGQLRYLADGATGSTVLATAAPAHLPAPDLATTVAVTAAMAPAMDAARAGAPAVRSVWAADTDGGVVRTSPGLDVLGEVIGGRIDPTAPLNHGDAAPFSALARSLTVVGTEARTWESEPVSPVDRETLPAFSTTYPTATAGEIGVTVFEPVGAGSHLVVGLDIDVRALIRGVAEIPSSDQRGAFTMLVGSSAELLGGGDAAPTALGIHGDWVGAHLASASPVMQNGLAGVLATGTAQTVQAKLGGSDQVLFTSPIPLAHWVLVSAVPRGGLLPDQASLTRGIDSGIHHVIRQAIPLAVGLSVVAFLLATLLARRLVGPVRSLTAAAQRLGSGNTEEPVPPTGDDEVGVLAESLERMRQEINASRDAILGAARELEGRVAARTAELRARNEELLALNALAGSLTHSLDPEAILEGALDALQAILPVRAGRAYLYESGRLRLLVDKAPQAAVAGMGDRLAQAASSSVDGRDLVIRPTAGGVLLALPVGTTDGAIGAISLLLREGWRLAGRSRALLRAIADQSGLALRTAALSAEGRELAVLEERTRLAREIHDTIAQQLTAVVLQLEAADALVERDRGRARSAVVEARDMARSALQEARRSVWNLRPATLAAGGLAAALGLEATRLEQRSGIAIRLRTDRLPHDFSVAPPTEVAFFRIAQEALNNAVQHSHAHAITLYMRLEGDQLVLGVEDDGVGFDPKASARGSFGLVGMAERARLVGAQFAVESSPGGGTRVEVRLAGAVATAQAATA